ncbi:MAG: hypothetical protein ACFB9M_15675 [Myxococcota bacterium]
MWEGLLILAVSSLNAGQAGQVAGTVLVSPDGHRSERAVLAAARLADALPDEGFVWVEASSCEHALDPVTCLFREVPAAGAGVTVAEDTGSESLLLSIFGPDGHLIDRVTTLGRHPFDLANLSSRVRTLLAEAHASGVRPGSTAASAKTVGSLTTVEVDERTLGDVEIGERIRVVGLEPGVHAFRFRAPGYATENLEVRLRRGEVAILNVDPKRLRSGARVANLSTAAAALGTGIGLAMAGFQDASCDLVSLGGPPPDACPNPPSVDLRLPGLSLGAFGFGLGLSELLLDRRLDGWIPWLFGLGAGGLAAGVSAAVY